MASEDRGGSRVTVENVVVLVVAVVLSKLLSLSCFDFALLLFLTFMFEFAARVCNPIDFSHPLAGHLLVNPPFYKLSQTIDAYLKVKRQTPSLSACFLVPSWPTAPWWPLLQGMRKIKTYPAGFPLFERPPDGSTQPAKPVKGIPLPVIFIMTLPMLHILCKVHGLLPSPLVIHR